MVKRDEILMRGLLHAYYWTDESLQNLLRAGGWQTLPRTQSMIMVNVADGCTRPSDLARRLGISRQAIQQTLAEMESLGLLQLVPDPGDARAKIVEFSPKGASIQRAALKAIRTVDAELERRLGKRDFEVLRRVLFATDWGPVLQKNESAAPPRRMRALRAVR
ncbi:MAG: helix-turn-helix domain-containing protein [Steroidobacteraceae bacterium]